MESGCVNNLLNCCRPSVPAAVSQFMSDHRERIEKIAMIAIFSATCLATAATLVFTASYIFKFSCLLASPALAATVVGVGYLASAILIKGSGLLVFPTILQARAERDFTELCQSKRKAGEEFQPTLTPEEKNRIRFIANQMKLGELLLTKGSHTFLIVLMSRLSFAAFPIGAVALLGASVLSYTLFRNCVWSPSPKEVGSVERAYLFTATSGADLGLSRKMFRVFYLSSQSAIQESNFTLLRLMKENLTPKEVRDNFGAFAEIIFAPEGQQVSREYYLRILFEIAFSGDVPAGAELKARREVIQEAGKAAIDHLERAAPTGSFSRVISSETTESISGLLAVYKNYLTRTGNAWEGMGTQVVETQNELEGVGTSIADI